MRHLLSNEAIKTNKSTLVQTENYIEVDALILYPFRVEADALGNPLIITNDIIQQLHDKYNKKVKKIYEFWKKTSPDTPVYMESAEGADIYKEHKYGLGNVVGSIVGKLWIKEIDGKKHLYARLRFKNKEAIDKVLATEWRYLSVGFDNDHDLFEISVVDEPAVDEVRILLSKSPRQNTYLMSLNNELAIAQTQLEKLENELDEKRTRLGKLQARSSFEEMLDKHVENYKIKPIEGKLIRHLLENTSDIEKGVYLTNRILSIISPRKNSVKMQQPIKIISEDNMKKVDIQAISKHLLSKGGLPPVDSDISVPPVTEKHLSTPEDDEDKEDYKKLGEEIHNLMAEGKDEEARQLSAKHFGKDCGSKLSKPGNITDPKNPNPNSSNDDKIAQVQSDIVLLSAETKKLKKLIKSGLHELLTAAKGGTADNAATGGE